MYLFFDTETSGLPRDFSAPVSRLANWPRLVQIGWVASDVRGNQTAAHQYLIRPVGFVIAPDAVRRHGITTERALAEGVELRGALDDFSAAARAARVLVAHNISFDENVVGAEFLRVGLENFLPHKQRRCTMRESVDYCRLPGEYGYKWPSLTELHEKLFGQAFHGAHGALADCSACMRCFFRLRELGVIE